MGDLREHRVVARIIECSCGAKVPAYKYERHRMEAMKKAVSGAFNRALRGEEPRG